MRKIFFSFLFLNIFLIPVVASAVIQQPDQDGTDYNKDRGIVVQCTGKYLVGNSGEQECTFTDILRQIKLIMNFAFVISLPITVIAAAYAGIKLLMAGASGNPGEVGKAKAMVWMVGKGFLFILAAWLIVYFITNALVKPEFNTFIDNS